MNNPDVEKSLLDCEDDLNRVKNIIDSMGIMSNVVPYLNKYAIIRACGAIEVGFKTIIADCCSNGSNLQVRKFINAKVRENSMNPRYSLMLKLAEEFDEVWAKSFKSKVNAHIKKDEILSSLESLVDCRNEFAHGGNPNPSVYDVIKYFNDAKIFIAILDEVVVQA